jgi:hypothetical protein
MDTRRISGSRESSQPPVEVSTDTGSIQLVELVELRSSITARRRHGLGAELYAFALLGVLAIIATLAIATSSGWSILDAY